MVDCCLLFSIIIRLFSLLLLSSCVVCACFPLSRNDLTSKSSRKKVALRNNGNGYIALHSNSKEFGEIQFSS